jgi:hypothetical protein
MRTAGVVLVIFGILLGAGALLHFASLTRAVAKVAPTRSANPWQRFRAMNNPARIWREHQRHFPYSSERRAMAILAAAAAACASLGLFLAK